MSAICHMTSFYLWLSGKLLRKFLITWNTFWFLRKSSSIKKVSNHQESSWSFSRCPFRKIQVFSSRLPSFWKTTMLLLTTCYKDYRILGLSATLSFATRVSGDISTRVYWEVLITHVYSWVEKYKVCTSSWIRSNICFLWLKMIMIVGDCRDDEEYLWLLKVILIIGTNSSDEQESPWPSTYAQQPREPYVPLFLHFTLLMLIIL